MSSTQLSSIGILLKYNKPSFLVVPKVFSIASPIVSSGVLSSGTCKLLAVILLL